MHMTLSCAIYPCQRAWRWRSCRSDYPLPSLYSMDYETHMQSSSLDYQPVRGVIVFTILLLLKTPPEMDPFVVCCCLSARSTGVTHGKINTDLSAEIRRHARDGRRYETRV
ncbi:hypothetical protein SETIT_7G251400v2 [Setaria italica]|uniref:Uncharacterized protein n=1 Tax=Setaria italica TaxID=4555 RepID=A0A368RZS8_SETIT|nr:hypothetical protein SETIT_7G251400v2 [Setaria italica]RCV35585.1 hypothetical protein SETIT_7G251400v2 [Setaria italica]